MGANRRREGQGDREEGQLHSEVVGGVFRFTRDMFCESGRGIGRILIPLARLKRAAS